METYCFPGKLYIVLIWTFHMYRAVAHRTLLFISSNVMNTEPTVLSLRPRTDEGRSLCVCVCVCVCVCMYVCVHACSLIGYWIILSLNIYSLRFTATRTGSTNNPTLRYKYRWWCLFPCLQGSGENVQPFIPCLHFYF